MCGRQTLSLSSRAVIEPSSLGFATVSHASWMQRKAASRNMMLAKRKLLPSARRVIAA